MISVSTIINTTAAYAESCELTLWNLPEAVVGKLKYGMPIKDAARIVSKKQGAKVYVKSSKDSELIMFKPQYQSTFNYIVLGAVSGRLTKVVVSYSEEFQKKVGGFDNALTAVTKRLSDTTGNNPLDSENSSDYTTFTTFWRVHGGVRLEVVGEEAKSRVFIRYTCVDMEADLVKAAAKKIDFGF